MKLKYFYKIDHKKEPVPGSNIRKKSKPGNQWLEIIPICCEPDSLTCTCGWRYFVQLGANKKPVDGTLIKRKSWPKMDEGIKYQEIQAPDCCAMINWTYEADNGTAFGTMEMYDNGTLIIFRELTDVESFTGSFRPSKSDSEIRIVLRGTVGCNLDNVLEITGGHTHSDEVISTDIVNPLIDYTFTFNNIETVIFAGQHCVIT